MIDINELRQSLGAVTPEEVGELLDRLEAAEKSDAESLAMYRKARDERDALRIELNEIRYGVAVAHDTIKALRAKVERMTKRLRLILEEPENTISNSKAMREMVRQARAALEESK